MLGSLVGAYDKLIPASFLQGYHRFTQGKARLKYGYLVQQFVYQFPRIDDGIPWDVVNRLFRVYLDELAAWLG